MGNPVSKTKGETTEKSNLNLTPQKVRILELDPRSPSDNVIRTPIEVLSMGKNLRNIDNPTTKITCMDPRSPTVEFTRTPIIVESNPNELKIYNKRIENVCKQLDSLTPMRNDLRRRPKLLDSSPISPMNVKRRNSVVGLLETNIDYIETDLDSVILKNSNNILKAKFLGVDICSEIIEDIVENVVEADTNNDNDVSNVAEKNKYMDEPPQSAAHGTLLGPEISISVEHSLDMKLPNDTTQSSNSEQLAKDENTTPLNTLLESESRANSPPNAEYEQHQTKIEETLQRNENIDTLIFELDKKLTNLIYEDKNLIASPKIQPKLIDGNRTPLGTKNENGNSKSISKLKVHDKPTLKGNYAVSRIPVFKEKKAKGRFQCENTPPVNKNFLEDAKMKKSQWDSDKTLII